MTQKTEDLAQHDMAEQDLTQQDTAQQDTAAENAPRAAPYFDPGTLRKELTALAHEYGHNDSKMRKFVLERLKDLVSDAREQARLGLMQDGDGRRCAHGLSLFQDELISLIYDFTIHHAYRAQNPSSAEHMAIIATGGYGRALMAPGSDVDLLFLLPYKQTPWSESVIEYMLYLLWDLGFKVGHATRTIDQSIRLSKEDMTIRTSLLDARLIWGDEQLFAEMEARFDKDIIKADAQNFVEAKLAEQDDRHGRSGRSRYLVEPNVKDGKGGLRDLHTLHWLAKYLSEANKSTEFVEVGVFSAEEYHTFRKCEDFLWTVRCHLHFLTNRAEERLTFDLQSAMAQNLGYTDHGGLRAVERFMKHYFLVAKDVGDLTRVMCSALEMRQLKKMPRLAKILENLPWSRGERLDTKDFTIENGRLTAAHDQIFAQDPVNLIRLFAIAEKHDVFFHPEVMRLVRASLRLIDDDLRENSEANKIFVSLITAKDNPESELRKMNESGVLGRFIPDFGRVVSMMQFNMYHHYTVDEHLIRSIGILNEIESGDSAEDHPLATEIFKTVQNRRALYVAMLLHDIAKGRDEDHSIAGARVARELCPRLGLSDEETELVAWLVETHLLMSELAQSRDINDPKTISDFAEQVQTPERLKLLLILTVADIRAVGPGVWNGWKGQLLRTLYYETEPVLQERAAMHGADQDAAQEIEENAYEQQQARIEDAQKETRLLLSDWSDEEFETYAARHYQPYWLRGDAPRLAEQARLIRQSGENDNGLVSDIRSDSFSGVTEITFFTPSHARLLSMIAGGCASAGANIVDAQISTTRDGMALDAINLRREFDRDEDELRRAERIVSIVQDILKGTIHFDHVMEEKRAPKGRMRAFSVKPRIKIDNDLSDEQTVIEIKALDRPGLLYDLTRILAELNLDIASAHIATFGEKAVDVFYITDLIGNKITSEERQKAIKNQLIEAALYENAAQEDATYVS